MASLIAALNFAWAFLLHCLKWPFNRGKNGKTQFIQNYPEFIPLSTSDKDWLLKFSRCFNCGLCDTVCPALETLPREKFPGPSFIVSTFARATTDFWAVDLDLSICESCNLCEKVCPNQVPIKEALAFIHAKMPVKQVA